MADEHRDQIRIVQETVAGTYHISEAWTESAGGLWIICNWYHEHDTFRVCCDRIRYCCEER